MLRSLFKSQSFVPFVKVSGVTVVITTKLGAGFGLAVGQPLLGAALGAAVGVGASALLGRQLAGGELAPVRAGGPV